MVWLDFAIRLIRLFLDRGPSSAVAGRRAAGHSRLSKQTCRCAIRNRGLVIDGLGEALGTSRFWPQGAVNQTTYTLRCPHASARLPVLSALPAPVLPSTTVYYRLLPSTTGTYIPRQASTHCAETITHVIVAPSPHTIVVNYAPGRPRAAYLINTQHFTAKIGPT